MILPTIKGYLENGRQSQRQSLASSNSTLLVHWLLTRLEKSALLITIFIYYYLLSMNKSLILRRHTCIQVDKKDITEVRDDIEIGQRSDVSTRQLHSIDNFPDVKKKPRRSTVTIAMSIAMIFYIFTTICNPNTSYNSEDYLMGIPLKKY